MSHSRKDRKGGHLIRVLKTDGMTLWTQTGRNFAKRFKTKQMRRHSRETIRGIMTTEPYDLLYDYGLEPEEDFEWYDDTELDWHDYQLDDTWDDPYDYPEEPYDPFDDPLDDYYYDYDYMDSYYLPYRMYAQPERVCECCGAKLP